MEFSFFSQCNQFYVKNLLNRRVDLKVKHIIITPKAFTLYFEQLLSQNGGYFDLDVLSFSRLYYKLGGVPLLPYESAVMEVKRILKQVDLSCFNRSKNYAGLCKKMLDSIYRLIESGLRPNDLPTNTPKMRDLKLVYQMFLQRNPNNLAFDMEKLIINTNFFDNAHIYALNFASFTNAEKKILSLIKQKALSVNVGKVKVPSLHNISIKKAEIYSAYSKADAIKTSAKRIINALNQGISINDMCMVCDQRSYDTAKRIFSEFNIPIYCNYKVNLKKRPFCQFILHLLRFDYTRTAFISLSKMAYSGISVYESSVFENYCNKYNIERNFFTPFSLGDFKLAEKVRVKLVNMVKGFDEGITMFGASYLSQFILHHEGDDSKGRMQSILSLIKDDKDFKELFLEAVDASYLRPLPQNSNCLVLSSVDSFRGQSFKRVFVLDFNEGVLPKNITDFGVLDNKESDLIKLCPSMDDLKSNSYNDITELLYLAEECFLSYIRSPSQRPSPLLYTIKDRVTNLSYNNHEKELQKVNEGNDIDFLLDYACNESSGLEFLMHSLNNPSEFSSSIYQVLQDKAEGIIKASLDKSETVDPDVFNLQNISASRLSTYFDCPYRHFIKYGLRAKQNEKGAINALDTGLIIHKVAEEFFLENFAQQALDNIIDKNLAPFAHKIDKILQEKLKNEIKSLCLRLKQNIFSGQFYPLGAEISLDSLIPAYIGSSKLIGSIDYADVYDNYVRIIDYKSGGTVGFESKLLYYGLKLQLPLYMYALIQGGYYAGAMFYYPFSLRWNNDNRFKGIFNNQPRLVFAMDNALANSDQQKVQSDVFDGCVSYYYGKANVTGSGNKNLEQIEQICNYAHQVSSLALSQISQGNIKPSPCLNKKPSCNYCDYLVACKFKGSPRILYYVKGIM